MKTTVAARVCMAVALGVGAALANAAMAAEPAPPDGAGMKLPANR